MICHRLGESSCPMPKTCELAKRHLTHPKEGANGAINTGDGIWGDIASPCLIGVCGSAGYFRPVRDACVACLVVLAGARFALSSSLTPLAPLA